MRIAQVAPLVESVPPRLYGGTERVVAYLTEELVAQGHDVTLFASGDSSTSARLIPAWPKALRLSGRRHDSIAPYMLLLEEVAARAARFDVVHFHVAELHLPLARRLDSAHVTTLHGRLDLPGLGPLYREFLDIPLVSISHAQRAPIAWAGWAGTVYHGLPVELLPFHPEPGRYLAFLGRISPEKRPDRAIAIAKAVGMPLRVAANVDRSDRDYFEREIRHLLADPSIEFVGEISDGEKGAFLGGAAALLFPIDWPEPFGLVMIEALACGTPVVAFRGGSVPEVIEHGVTGFVVTSMDEAIAATRAVGSLDRRRCRSAFDRRFSAPRMAGDYLRIYETLRAERRRARRAMSGAA
jgi:glycosyltransferase involved in cell wall biosynthesis